MKTTSMATLMMENQNSTSPNSLTPMRLMARTIASAMRASAHFGKASDTGFQKYRNVAIAVASAMRVKAQFRKWNQPAAYAPFSPMNSRL